MARSSFKLQLYPQHVAAIRFKGSVDDLLAARAVEECLARDCYRLVIDLTEATHATSAAISRLLQQRDVVQGRNGRLVFVEPVGNVAIVFNMIGLREVFAVYANLDDALRELINRAGGTGKRPV